MKKYEERTNKDGKRTAVDKTVAYDSPAADTRSVPIPRPEYRVGTASMPKYPSTLGFLLAVFPDQLTWTQPTITGEPSTFFSSATKKVVRGVFSKVSTVSVQQNMRAGERKHAWVIGED